MDAANKRFGKRVVFIVPLHDAVMKLRRMVAAGTFPRVATQEALFWGSAGSGDEHGNNQIYALGPLCAYAAIHGRSTAGMRPTFPAGGNFTGPHSKVPGDDEQIDVLAKNGLGDGVDLSKRGCREQGWSRSLPLLPGPIGEKPCHGAMFPQPAIPADLRLAAGGPDRRR